MTRYAQHAFDAAPMACSCGVPLTQEEASETESSDDDD